MNNNIPSNRPQWDRYFLDMAQLVSTRSPDPNTKHGCVLVDKDFRVLSTGYNGPVQGIPHQIIDWERPNKYAWMIHAEDNAVAFSKCDLKGCSAYITGEPCVECLRRLLQVGINRIIYGDKNSACISDYTRKVVEQLIEYTKIYYKKIV